MEVGGSRVPGLTRIFLLMIPKPVLIYSLSVLLKVVGYYDLSVLSMSVMGFQKKFGWGGWVG